MLSAFCSSLQTVLGHEASRSKGLEIPDALKLLERLDLRGKIISRGRNLLREIDRCENRRTRHRLCLSGQGQSEDATPGHQNGFRRAGFSPCAHGIAMSKRRMGASNGARSTCCLPRSRRDSKQVADGFSSNLSRHTFAPSQEERRVAESQSKRSTACQSPACPQPPRHRRCWASIAIHWQIEIMHRNKDVIPFRRGRLHESFGRTLPGTFFLPHRLRSQNPEIRGTLTNPRHRASRTRQKPRNPAVLRFLLKITL